MKAAFALPTIVIVVPAQTDWRDRPLVSAGSRGAGRITARLPKAIVGDLAAPRQRVAMTGHEPPSGVGIHCHSSFRDSTSAVSAKAAVFCCLDQDGF
jgi:hypothetical protein